MHLLNIKSMSYAVLLMIFVFFISGFTQKGLKTEQGYYLIDVASMEQQLKIGNNDILIAFYDSKTKKPVNKSLTLEVIPWMATSEHSVSELPTVTSQDDNKYLIQNIFFDREGIWQIYIRIDKGNKEDAAVFDVKVFK